MKKVLATFVLVSFLAVGCGESTPTKPATTPDKAKAGSPAPGKDAPAHPADKDKGK